MTLVVVGKRLLAPACNVEPEAIVILPTKSLLEIPFALVVPMDNRVPVIETLPVPEILPL